MVVAWLLRDETGGLITTFFDERKAFKAKEKLESKGKFVKIDKVFDHHLKEREPIVKQKKKTAKDYVKKFPEWMPAGTYPIMMFVKPGDLIVSELGIGANQRGSIIENVTRLVISDKGLVVPVIAHEVKDDKRDDY